MISNKFLRKHITNTNEVNHDNLLSKNNQYQFFIIGTCNYDH